LFCFVKLPWPAEVMCPLNQANKLICLKNN